MPCRPVRSGRRWEAVLTILSHAALAFGAAIMIVPFYWMVITSLSEPGSAFSTSSIDWLPRTLRWQNYEEAINRMAADGMGFWRLYANSLIVAAVGTFGQVLTSSMAAYAFARLRFPGREPLFVGYLATMMVPGSVTLVPVFAVVRALGWVNTYWALIVPGIFSPWGTFMLRQFFLSLPRELEESARIDGASLTQIYTRVTLPLARTALATLATFTFMGFWGSFMWPLIVTVTPELRTLPIGLTVFTQRYSTEYSLLMAASVMATLPAIVVFLFNQRYFIESIKLQGIKG
ncbi:MAG: carbohydrate ABC transporter permease [Chthonomonadales bacterium]|nr:carbohydrate ABC transporter permease [Chthonomonadales bacterium]